MKKIIKTTDEWQKQLTPDQYHICREKGTERPFTGKFNLCKDPGTYVCICCENPLFESKAKFDSGSGWPSFSSPLSSDAVTEDADDSLFMRRTEVLCAVCDSHLGHVFPDGPAPKGLRYCINSASLNLILSNDLQKNDKK